MNHSIKMKSFSELLMGTIISSKSQDTEIKK